MCALVDFLGAGDWSSDSSSDPRVSAAARFFRVGAGGGAGSCAAEDVDVGVGVGVGLGAVAGAAGVTVGMVGPPPAAVDGVCCFLRLW